MEHVEGRTLKEEVEASGPLSEARVREVLMALAGRAGAGARCGPAASGHHAGQRDAAPGRDAGTDRLRGGGAGDGGPLAVADDGADAGVCADRAVQRAGAPGAVDGHLRAGSGGVLGAERGGAGGCDGAGARGPAAAGGAGSAGAGERAAGGGGGRGAGGGRGGPSAEPGGVAGHAGPAAGEAAGGAAETAAAGSGPRGGAGSRRRGLRGVGGGWSWWERSWRWRRWAWRGSPRRSGACR